jgi:hypothetical protein
MHVFLSPLFRCPVRVQNLRQCYACLESLMSTAKQDVESLLSKLPDNSSVEDIQYHLYVLDKVRRGLEDARVNGALSQDEVESRLSKWLTE